MSEILMLGFNLKKFISFKKRRLASIPRYAEMKPEIALKNSPAFL